jgi:hypothetical protein
MAQSLLLDLQSLSAIVDRSPQSSIALRNLQSLLLNRKSSIGSIENPKSKIENPLTLTLRQPLPLKSQEDDRHV